MRHLVLSALCAAVALPTVAADPPKGPPIDTSFLRRYAQTRGFMLGRPVKPKITPDGKTVLFLRSEATVPKQKLFAFDIATGATTELLAPETLLHGSDENVSAEEMARRERQRVTVGGFADFFLDEPGNRVLVTLSGRPYVFDRTTKAVRELKAGPGSVVDPKWSPDGKYVSYVRVYDVYAYDLAADKELAVTTGGTAVKTHGLAEFVAQEEMGRHTGYWWSPDSTRIAYEEADHTGVEVWSIADPFKPGTKPPEQFYPRPGKKNVSVRLGIVPVTGGDTLWAGWDRAKYEYLTAVDWQKEGGLVLELQDRRQREVSVVRVGARAEMVSLFTETDPAWVNLPDGLKRWYDGSITWLGTKWGKAEIQYRNGNGQVTEVPVTGDENPLDIVSIHHGLFAWPGLNGYGRLIAYHAAPDPTQRHVRVQIAQEGFSLFPGSEKAGYLTTEPGYHTGIFNGGKDAPFIIASTTLKQMPRTKVFIPHLSPAGELPSVAADPPFTPNVTVQKIGDYWTAIVRPRDFDPKKKYPVIVDVYGGPRHVHVVQAMRNWLVPQWLADQGFVVVAVDNRGTPGRGREWERAVYQKFGTVPLEDQVKGLHALCDKFPELDRDRVGIVGWSFGGYLSANAVLRRPDVFKAAVAGAPVTDWEDYDTHYTERYLGVLPESRQAYDDASLLPRAKDLSRPLLLVHGTADDNVYFRHSLKLADALFRAGKEFEFLPLPGVTHQYTADPEVTERLWARSVAFFKRHLGEAK